MMNAKLFSAQSTPGACALQLVLPANQVLALPAGAPARIDCCRGALWITQEGDIRDLVLAPGDSFAASGERAVTVSAFEPARLALSGARISVLPARIATRWSWPRWLHRSPALAPA